MAKYAGVVVDISLEKLDRVFEYLIPESLEEEIAPGVSVWIPFGKGNRKVRGFVLTVGDTCCYQPEKIKPLLSLCDKTVRVEGQLIQLASWMSQRYGCTLNQALKTVIPVKKKIKEQQKQLIQLKKTKEEAEIYIKTQKRKKARIRVLKMLLEKDLWEKEELLETASVSFGVLKELEQEKMISILGETIYRMPEIPKEEAKEIFYNQEQQEILQRFYRDQEQGIRKDYLVYGVTGSGKTEVYMAMIEKVLEKGQQAIVLIPEIALSYQMVMRFYGRFGEKVSVLHSKMSAGERFDQFQRAKNGEVSVMIGPRSAVFTPFGNLGMILMDEEHESSYQSETTPKYHTREVAKKRCQLAKAILVLGSATPSLESFYEAKNGTYELLTLKHRVSKGKLPQVQVVDLREELRSGNRSVFSRPLQEMMEERLAKKEQILLFLNRRGMTGFISCRSCGTVVKCPHCDISMTLHKDGKMRCHYCGYTREKISYCEKCGSPYIGGFRAGTQSIEEAVKNRFPKARVLRMDLDTTRNKGSYERILKSFSAGEADILIGTQMIVKGHDFPKVTLVGVLLADLSLHESDYRASEKTFQLLTQAVGRAGRNGQRSDAVIQTYQPDHYSILLAAKQDYESFYQAEICYRQMLGYPPVSQMMVVLLLSKDESLLEKEAEKLRIFLDREKSEQIRILGPSPAAVSKIQDVYRQVIYFRQKSLEQMIELRKKIEVYAGKQLSKEVWMEFELNPLQWH